MKIIKKGSIPPKPRPWWVTQTLVCPNCNTQFQLEDDDEPARVCERRPNGKQWVECNCPVCDQPHTHFQTITRQAAYPGKETR